MIAGVGNLQFIVDTMDNFQYRNIIKQNVKQSAEKVGIKDSFAFYQDNDPHFASCKALINTQLPETIADSSPVF